MQSKILDAVTPKMIPIITQPLHLGVKVKYMDIRKFEKIIGQTFLERIDISTCPIKQSEIKEDITSDLSSAELKHQFEQILKRPREDLALYKINDQVGYGVIALNDIPKNTVLCSYAGRLIKIQRVKQNDHAIDFHGLDAILSTEQFRGIASFFQHLPTTKRFKDAKQLSQVLRLIGQNVSERDLKLNDELYSTEFLDIEQSLATENVTREYICYEGIPVVLMVTNRTVKAGEQIGFNYGKNYWLSRGVVPEFFNVSGSVIPSSAYRRNFYQLKFAEFTYTGETSLLIDQLKNGKSQVELTDDQRQVRKIDSQIVMKELIRIRAISELECQLLQAVQNSKLSQSSAILFPANQRDPLLVKYKLPDNSQTSLEKGLRNAATNNQIEDLNAFLKLVKNINATDANPAVKRTAVHWAAFRGNTECYEALVVAGADINIPDAKGNTALGYMEAFLVAGTRFEHA